MEKERKDLKVIKDRLLDYRRQRSAYAQGVENYREYLAIELERLERLNFKISQLETSLKTLENL